MGIKERREREKLDRRNSILSAAEDLFWEKGYEATLDEIAEKVELSKPTLYLYFKNKDDLYAAIALDAFQALKELYKNIVESEASAEDKVKSLYRTFIDFALEHKQVNRITELVLSGNERKRISPELSERINSNVANLLGYATAACRQAMAEGFFAEGDPLLISIVIWRSLLGLVSLATEEALPDQDPAIYQRLFDMAFDIFMEGTKKR